MNDIIFNKGEGGLGRALAGEDHISGMVFYTPVANIPAAFITDPIAQIFSIEEAEALGITSESDVPQFHYELKNLYEANKQAVCFVAIYASTPVTGTADFSKILDVQRFSEGKIRQMGVHNQNDEFEVGHAVSIQAACDTLEAEHKPLSVVLTEDTNSFDSSTLPDLRAQDAKNVSVVIGADFIANTTRGGEFTMLGATIGHLSAAKVNENIGWVGRFNVAKNSTNEFDVPVLNISGAPTIKSLSPTAINAINDKGYIFLVKHIGKAGTYFNDTHTAKVVTSDYAFIENNRTIDKAIRGIRTFLLPSLNAPLYVNEDGTLTEDTVADFTNEGSKALEKMRTDGEISAFEFLINPAQNVLSSSKLITSVKIVPVGVARNIEVNIGFALKITQ